MACLKSNEISKVYVGFDAPIMALDCGQRCAPYNAYGVPFCCDTGHTVPTAYDAEWAYLQANTDLWHLWETDDPVATRELQAETPTGQVVLECLGHNFCQRDYRTITCRAFPFFPYLTVEGEFIGLSYYWQYEDRCWVISHLDKVSPVYTAEFTATYEDIFAKIPEERENFRYHSVIMRRVFGRKKRKIPLLHRNGQVYLVTPKDGDLEEVEARDLPKHGDYAIAAEMPFPDER